MFSIEGSRRAALILLLAASCTPDGALTSVCKDELACVIDAQGMVQTVSAMHQLSGACQVGRAVCKGLDTLVACDGYVGPSPEMCNGLDDDCDGVVDDFSIECWNGRAVVMGGQSICAYGNMTCNEGVWSSCTGTVLPRPEVCDGLDNDCDGETDEPEPGVCGPQDGIGVCVLGTQVCLTGEAYCAGDAVLPTPELCNGLDDDCDGVIDENIERGCQTACGRGTERCSMGAWVECSAPMPREETCDGADDDCDGETDEGCSCIEGSVAPCRNGITDPSTGEQLTCGVGVTVCDETGMWGQCTFVGTQGESCDNWDNDCDGVIDDFEVTCGDAMTAGIGACALGIARCEMGVWDDCRGAVSPLSEVCNGIDDDCDGEIDEDLNPHDSVDIVFIADGSGSMCGLVNSIKVALGVYAQDFAGSKHRLGLIVFPGPGGTDIIADVLIPLTDAFSFLSALTQYSCNRPGYEPAWDAVVLAASPIDSLELGWRVGSSTAAGAQPYLIVLTDETPNQGMETEQTTAYATSHCLVGGCVPGDGFEVFVITQLQYFWMWDTIVFNDQSRLFNLYPIDNDRYVDILRGVFTNVCI